MDATLQRELARSDPHVAFRAATGHRHSTWARTFHSLPQLFVQPESLEEIQKVVTLARRCRRRIVAVGAGHSPSDLTCTSSWMVNLDRYNAVLHVDASQRLVTMQAGIRLQQLIAALKERGLALPTLGSIVDQSIAGAIATGTHGSGARKGVLSDYVQALGIVLANGRLVHCSMANNPELFRAGLVSLGALGIIVEVSLRAEALFRIRWEQSLVRQEDVIARWHHGFWGTAEFERVWLFPYMKQCVLWQAHKTTTEPLRQPKQSWFSGRIGHHLYHTLLWMAHYVPRILPWIEQFVIAVQYGGPKVSGVEEGMEGLQMDCLYSQFVNEWAIPLERGPEALQRLSAWLHGDTVAAGIPFDPSGVWVHAPIEVRIAAASERAYLANTYGRDTLLLNATLYRPYQLDPPCRARYYEAFEWLMLQLDGRPHWAKNFSNVTSADTARMYPHMHDFLAVRNEVDPDGMFLGAWHRRYLLPSAESGQPHDALYPLEERQVAVRAVTSGGLLWEGEQVALGGLSARDSEESFDLMQAAETKASVLLDLTDSSSSEHLAQGSYVGN